MSNDTNKILEQLHWRYATKVFDKSKKINTQDWHVLEQSLVLSPSSYGLQPWKFLVIENQEIREKLRAASYGQSPVTDASKFVVFTTLKSISSDYIKSFIKSTAETRGAPIESLAGFESMMIKTTSTMPPDSMKNWNQRQSYIAMGFIMEAAAFMGIDTLAMEGLNPTAYDEILGLTGTEYGTVAAVALGYRDASDKYQHAKKVRFETNKIIQHIV